MATTDHCREIQRPLAEYAYILKEKYNHTLGQTKTQFMTMYDHGEIELSTVYENLFVLTRNSLGLPTKKVSVDGYDFVKVTTLGEQILGDMKTSVLKKDGARRRFVISSVAGKSGYIYAACWNWITNQPAFFALPPSNYGIDQYHPTRGYKIMVNSLSGARTGGKYNINHAYNTWEEMAAKG